MQQSVSVSASPRMLRPRWWPEGWWKIVDMRIGIIPIPIYVILIALLVGFVFTGDIKGEISVMIAVLVIGGFTCAEIGKRIPVLRNIGAAAIFATFRPVGARVLQAVATANRKIGRRVHKVYQLPLPVHRLHHRR